MKRLRLNVASRDALRYSQIALLGSVSLFFTLVVINNITDFDSNYQFVHHVLAMDAIFPNSHELWRAVHNPAVHLVFYVSIICWEALTMVLCWSAVITLFNARASSFEEFLQAKSLGILALTAGLMLWMTAFLCVGGEYFLMWQSKIWNGQDAAFRMFSVEAIILVVLLLPEPPLADIK